MKYNAVT